jgi:hypothetical protein
LVNHYVVILSNFWFNTGTICAKIINSIKKNLKKPISIKNIFLFWYRPEIVFRTRCLIYKSECFQFGCTFFFYLLLLYIFFFFFFALSLLVTSKRHNCIFFLFLLYIINQSIPSTSTHLYTTILHLPFFHLSFNYI